MLSLAADGVRNRGVFRILPDNPLSGPKSSEDVRVCGDHRPFWHRYWVASGDSKIVPGEFLKSHIEKQRDLLAELLEHTYENSIT